LAERSLSRAQWHLASLYRRLRLQLREAERLEEESRKDLQEMLKLKPRPDYLKECTDEMILYDHLQPTMRGKFTERKLLKLIQTAATTEANGQPV
jgi:hypothetical protein